jgi:hypothetical protein
MALREEFREALERAEVARQQQRKPFLHQVIAGPGRSGKTHLARQYIKALVDKGLVEDKVEDFWFPGKHMREAQHHAERAKGGILLVDDIPNLRTVNQQETSALRELAEIIIDNECTVVMLGAEDTLRHFMDDRGIQHRMNRPVILTQEADNALQHPISVKKNPFTLRKPGRKAETS